jgi:predicted dehydrogenase
MPDDRKDLTRRELLKKATLAGGLAALGGVWTEADAHAAATAPRSPNEKLDVACIGVGGQGASDLREIAGDGSRVNIVALCDVNDEAAANSYKRFPDARTYRDFRRMLDRERRNVDAVVISTPDHTHAVATVLAMQMGKHVYCQKPLTRTVSEARIVTETARRHNVVTQMGNQGHPAYARTVEYVRAGIVGPIREVHVMTDRPIWPQGMDRPDQAQTPPITLDWNLWLGPAAERPYHSAYLPFVWRGWWDFGTGALGDMACHLMDGAFWALRLGAPLTVEAEGEPRHPDSARMEHRPLRVRRPRAGIPAGHPHLVRRRQADPGGAARRRGDRQGLQRLAVRRRPGKLLVEQRGRAAPAARVQVRGREAAGCDPDTAGP